MQHKSLRKLSVWQAVLIIRIQSLPINFWPSLPSSPSRFPLCHSPHLHTSTLSSWPACGLSASVFRDCYGVSGLGAQPLVGLAVAVLPDLREVAREIVLDALAGLVVLGGSLLLKR